MHARLHGLFNPLRIKREFAGLSFLLLCTLLTLLILLESAFAAERTFGNVGRNTLEGPNYKSVDLSLLTYSPLTERLRLRFRAEFFNAFNFVNFNLPSIAIAPDLLTPQRTPDPARTVFGTVNSARSGRETQFALRIEY